MKTGLLFSPELLAVIGSIITAIITATVTFKVAKANTDKDCAISREEFVDTHMRTLIDTYQKELSELRTDIGSLVQENKLLREEIIQLRTKIMEMEVSNHEQIRCEGNTRG